MATTKTEGDGVAQCSTVEDMDRAISKGGAPVMRSKADDLSIWQSIGRYKVVGLISMAAAFSASLDGYRKKPHGRTKSVM
jgi:hypothetical protein